MERYGPSDVSRWSPRPFQGLYQGLYWCARAARVQENQPMENSMKRTAALLAAAVSAVCLAGPASAQWPTRSPAGNYDPADRSASHARGHASELGAQSTLYRSEISDGRTYQPQCLLWLTDILTRRLMVTVTPIQLPMAILMQTPGAMNSSNPLSIVTAPVAALTAPVTALASPVAQVATAPFAVASEATAPLVTGRSVATGQMGRMCSTPVKSCELYQRVLCRQRMQL